MQGSFIIHESIGDDVWECPKSKFHNVHFMLLIARAQGQGTPSNLK